jgi:cytochrome c2
MRSVRTDRWLILGWAAALGFTLAREWPAPPKPEKDPAGPAPLAATAPPLPTAAPLLWALAAIVVVGGLWFGLASWSQTRELEAVARALTGGDPARAPMLIARYGCGGCHTIAGLPGADGQAGPPLTGLHKRVFIAGGLPNTARNLIDWIVAPQAFAPNSAMPATGILVAQARDVAAWLYAH